MAGRVEGRQHIFDVIKVNMFGVKQSRVMILEQADPTTGQPGRVQIATGGGKVKRDFDVTAIAGIERSGEKASEDQDRSVTFKFFENGANKEARRTIMFVSKRQRDAFVTEIEKMNPKLVARKEDGSLMSKADEKKAKDDAKKDAEKLAAAAAKSGAAGGGGGAAGSKTGSGAAAAAAAAGADEDDGGAAGGRFFAMEENDYGFSEPRMVTFSKDNEHIVLVDATAGGTANSDLRLRRLKTVALHASDKSVLELMFHDGSVLKSVNKAVVLTFGSRAQRERFHRELLSHIEALFSAIGMKVADVDIDDKWRGPLPTKSFFRFEASMNKPKKQQVALLVSPRKRKVFVIKASHIPAYEPGCLIPSAAALFAIISIVPYRLQLQRHPKNPRILQISDGGPQTPFATREASEYEFLSAAERERFCAYLAQAASADDAPLLKEALASSSSSSASSPSTALALSSAPPTKSAPGTVRSTYRQPSVSDTSWMWGAQWPHDDVKVWVGTYNVSGTPPPDNEKEFDKWLPAPARDIAATAGGTASSGGGGPRDLYVIGLQELGPSSNREAWGAALAKHLAGKPDAATSAAAGTKSYANSVSYASATASDSEATYVLVDHVYMWEMGMWVFVRTPHVPDITSVSHADLPTGLAVAKAITGVQLGNKGGIGIGLRWRETTCAFVMCHLAARPDPVRLRKREADYKTITRKLKLETAQASEGLDFVHAHDHVWFFGDVNYRIDLPYDRCVTLYKQKQFNAIMAHDQLIREQAKKRVFVGFTEGKIDFAPTYRWERDREEFSWKRGQAPSYTDRILYRSLPGVAEHVTQTAYDGAIFLYGSDHRAVSSGYTVALRRYYSAPTPPMTFVPYPLPTFFSALDAAHLPVPVVLFAGLKISGVQAMTAPAAIYLTLHAPWLESGGVMCGTMTAAGLNDAQKDGLRKLKTELAALAKADSKKRKEEAKEAKLKAKAAKKEAKAKGEKQGPKVTVQGAAAEDASKKSGSGITRANMASFLSGGGSDKKSGAGVDDDADEHDSEDEEDDDDDGAGGNGDDYTVLEEDAEYAASASAASAMMDTGTMDPKKKALLDITCEYSWMPAETSIPPLKPVCWDPRLLRFSHVHIIAHASPGADGSYLAIGGAAAKSKPKAGQDIVGQATIPIAPLVKRAQAAIELALQVQAEEDDDDETDAAVELLLKGGSGAAAAASAASNKAKKSKANAAAAAIPVGPTFLDAEVAASTTGLIEASPDAFARAFAPDGIPWALTAPPTSFSVDVEFSGQPTGKLTGTAVLRSSTDKGVAGRVAAGGGTVASSNWNLDTVLSTMEKAARDAITVGDAGNRSTMVNLETAPKIISRESFTEEYGIEEAADYAVSGIIGAGSGGGSTSGSVGRGSFFRSNATIDDERTGSFGTSGSIRRGGKKIGSFAGGVVGGARTSSFDDAGSTGSGATPRESFSLPLPPPPAFTTTTTTAMSVPTSSGGGIAGFPPPPPPPSSGYAFPGSPVTAAPPSSSGFSSPSVAEGSDANNTTPRQAHHLKPTKPGKSTPTTSTSTTSPPPSDAITSPSSDSFAASNKPHLLKPSKLPKATPTNTNTTIPETAEVGDDNGEDGENGSNNNSNTNNGSDEAVVDANGHRIPSKVSPRHHLKPMSRPAVSATKMTMTATSSTGPGASSMQVDARFAAFFEAQFSKKIDSTETADADGTVISSTSGGTTGGGGGSNLIPRAPKVRIAAGRTIPIAAAKKKTLTIPGVAVASSAAVSSGEGTTSLGESAVETNATSSSSATTTTASATGAGSGAHRLKPTKTIPKPITAAAGASAAGAETEVTASVAADEDEEGGERQQQHDEADDDEQQQDEEGAESSLNITRTAFDEDSDDEHESDDDDDQEEEQISEEAKKALIIKLAMEQAKKKKREAMAAKIVSRAETVLGLLNVAAEKARASTNKNVVAMWMPVTATNMIAANVRSGVGSTSQGAGLKHGFTASNTFQGVSKILNSGGSSSSSSGKVGGGGGVVKTTAAPASATSAAIVADEVEHQQQQQEEEEEEEEEQATEEVIEAVTKEEQEEQEEQEEVPVVESVPVSPAAIEETSGASAIPTTTTTTTTTTITSKSLIVPPPAKPKKPTIPTAILAPAATSSTETQSAVAEEVAPSVPVVVPVVATTTSSTTPVVLIRPPPKPGKAAGGGGGTASTSSPAPAPAPASPPANLETAQNTSAALSAAKAAENVAIAAAQVEADTAAANAAAIDPVKAAALAAAKALKPKKAGAAATAVDAAAPTVATADQPLPPAAASETEVVVTTTAPTPAPAPTAAAVTLLDPVTAAALAAAKALKPKKPLA